MSFTLIIIIFTVIISISAFSNGNILDKLILWPARMDNPNEYHRLFSSGFVHADWIHLLFNMYVLYIFGQHVEGLYSSMGRPYIYILMYLFALVASSLPSFFKHRNNYGYRALGASGAVAAVMFSFIYYAPWSTLYFWFIPMPSIVFGVAYLAYSAYAAKKANDNVGHDAHFYGAVFGFIFTLIFDPTHGGYFIEQIAHPQFNF